MLLISKLSKSLQNFSKEFIILNRLWVICMDGISIAVYWFRGLYTNYRAYGPTPYSKQFRINIVSLWPNLSFQIYYKINLTFVTFNVNLLYLVIRTKTLYTHFLNPCWNHPLKFPSLLGWRQQSIIWKITKDNTDMHKARLPAHCVLLIPDIWITAPV